MTHTFTRTHTGPWMVFDVESNGLYGEGFAAGWVVVGETGKTLTEGFAVAPCDDPEPFVRENVLPALPEPTAPTVRFLRQAFWQAWSYWRERGAKLAADVPWPVEARFLLDCVGDDTEWRAGGPYPLVDIASVRLAVGLDPLAEAGRRPNELPAHNPLADARQSARLLVAALALAVPS